MSAEILRRAAALMRERAEAATDGPWQFEPAGDYECGEPACCSEYWDNRIWGGGVVIAESHLTSDADSKHIASWHPVVALAVAKWLDAIAAPFDSMWEADEDGVLWGCDFDGDPLRLEDSTDSLALTVARAYLGEQK